MYAWVTLLSKPDHVVAVRALQHSLTHSGTQWPVVVMATENIASSDLSDLVARGCIVHQVELLRPRSNLRSSYAASRFDLTWTKLRAWQLTEYCRVVLLDADMLVMRNMDELFSLSLDGFAIDACHACRCNLEKIASYRKDWRPENCHYTWQERAAPAPETLSRYLNSGLIVLTPDRVLLDQMAAEISELDDLSAFAFSEQDFLNIRFADNWFELPYVYNAPKTLPYQHGAMWRWDEVKNLHYMLAKPWTHDVNQPSHQRDRYYDVDKLWWDRAGALLSRC